MSLFIVYYIVLLVLSIYILKKAYSANDEEIENVERVKYKDVKSYLKIKAKIKERYRKYLNTIHIIKKYILYKILRFPIKRYQRIVSEESELMEFMEIEIENENV